MEASAIPAQVGLARKRIAIGAPLLRLRSDEQLVSLFRDGSDEAFRVIHDRYRQRLFAYTRQMLSGSPADAEDAVQEIFVRAYAGLRVSDRDLALRAWLYRVAHNRCVDELRRPQPLISELIASSLPGSGYDPVVRTEQRDALRTLIVDVGRLPDQQRSALLMRELTGMTYVEISGALGVTVAAVKSLLVRARVGLAHASQARNTACSEIRESVIISHDRGARPSAVARRHMRDCAACRQFRADMRGMSRQLAAFAPTLGPLGMLAKLLGAGGGGGAAGGAIAGTGGTAGGVAGSGATASLGALTGASHVVTILAAAVVTAGGAIELGHFTPTAVPPHHGGAAHAARIVPDRLSEPAIADAGAAAASTSALAIVIVSQPNSAAIATQPAAPAGTPPPPAAPRQPLRQAGPALPLTETMDPDNMAYYIARAAAAATSASSAGQVTHASSGSSATSSASAGSATGTSTGAPTASTSTEAAGGAATSPTQGAVSESASSPTTGAPTSASSTSTPVAPKADATSGTGAKSATVRTATVSSS